MADGLLNPRERAAMSVIEAILKQMLPKAATKGEALAFSVPAPAAGKDAELTYHEASMRRVFEGYGYDAMAINEGLAVVFAELENDNFTERHRDLVWRRHVSQRRALPSCRSRRSCSASPTHRAAKLHRRVGRVCAPGRAGDTGQADQGRGTRSLARAPKSKHEKALQIYYEDLIHSLVGALKQSLNRAEQLPRADSAATDRTLRRLGQAQRLPRHVREGGARDVPADRDLRSSDGGRPR